MKRSVIAILVLLTAFSCHKPEIDCNYSVKTWVTESDRGELLPAGDVTVYAFFADTADWTVLSPEDAREGRITSRHGGETRSFDHVAVNSGGRNYFSEPFTQRDVMLVAAHGSQPMYAYADANLQYDLGFMEVSLVFQPFLPDSAYVQGLWRVFNGETTVTVDCRYSISALQQRLDAGSEVAMTTTRAHVFYGIHTDDAEDWSVLSYEDAVNGIVRSRTNQAETRLPSVAEIYFGEGNSSNETLAVLKESKAMLVVYDTLQPMYGYADADMQGNPPTQSDKVVFRPYLPNITIYAADDVRWTVVMEDTYVSTHFVANIRQRHGSTTPEIPLTTTVGFAFYKADTAEWTVASYEDAMEGRITAKEGGEVRNADENGVPGKYGLKTGFDLRQDGVILVICDTEQPMYSVGVPRMSNWPETITDKVLFRPDLPDSLYMSGIWKYYNGGTTVPGQEEPEPEPEEP